MTPLSDHMPARASAWLVPLVLAALGAVVLVAEATSDDLASGIGWFAVLLVSALLLAFGGRFQAVRDARGDAEDERDRAIAVRAMAVAGTVLIVVLTGAIAFTLARGEDPSPYTQLAAAGGASYGIALLVLRRRS